MYIRIRRGTPKTLINKKKKKKNESDVIIISALLNPVMFGTVGFDPKRCIQNIELWDYIMSFSDYRLFSKPVVTLLSPETAINFHFTLGKVYIFGYDDVRLKTLFY